MTTPGADLFADLPPISDTELKALRDRLAVDAQAAGLVDGAYRTIDSPVGALLLAATPLGLVRIGYDRGVLKPASVGGLGLAGRMRGRETNGVPGVHRCVCRG